VAVLDKVIGLFLLISGALLVCCSCPAGGKADFSGKNQPGLSSGPEGVPFVPAPGLPGIDSLSPMLVNPDFTVEELSTGPIEFKNNRLPLVNRAPGNAQNPQAKSQSILWLSAYTLFAMRRDSNELWAIYSPYADWSVESFCLSEAGYPNVLVGVSMAYIFPNNRILEVDLEQGRLNGYFELPKSLAGPYVLRSLGDSMYFAVSYQGDNSWRLSLLNLGDDPAVEKAVILRDLGLPSARGYHTFSEDGATFYFNNRGLFISVDTESLEVLKVQEMRNVPSKQIEFISGRNELCALSYEFLTLLDPKSFNVLQSFEIPMQPAIRDDIDAKSGQVFLKKGDPTYLTPSGVGYRDLTDELIITFDYSPNMLLIDCVTGEQRFVEFASESITVGQPVYLDEEHLLIGGKYVYNFKTGTAEQVSGAEGSMLLDSVIYY